MRKLEPVFLALRSILKRYAKHLVVKIDAGDALTLDSRHVMENKQPLFFGAVQIRKSYVSYYLMPVYVDPGLLDGMSDGLKKWMQGNSCFNFAELDEALFEELAALTEAGFASYKRRGYI